MHLCQLKVEYLAHGYCHPYRTMPYNILKAYIRERVYTGGGIVLLLHVYIITDLVFALLYLFPSLARVS